MSGLVASLSRPGGNVTGTTNFAAELGGRRLQLLHGIIPNLERVAALASTQVLFTKPFFAHMAEAAPALGIQMIDIKINGPAEFERSFAAMAQDRAQAVVVQASSIRIAQASSICLANSACPSSRGTMR